LNKPFRLVSGGAERQDSVWNGLEATMPGTEIVAIQDGARPCTSRELISATIAAAREMGAAVAAQPVTDTSRKRWMARPSAGRWIVPGFGGADAANVPGGGDSAGVIARAEKKLQVTDDTAACELIGQPVRLVAGAAPNPKLPFRRTCRI